MKNIKITGRILLPAFTNWEEKISDFKFQMNANQGIFGELGHPELPLDFPVINHNKISHIIKEIYYDDMGNIDCFIDVLDTPNGTTLQKIIDDDIPIQIKPRMLGIKHDNGEIDIINLITFDIVFKNIEPV